MLHATAIRCLFRFVERNKFTYYDLVIFLQQAYPTSTRGLLPGLVQSWSVRLQLLKECCFRSVKIVLRVGLSIIYQSTYIFIFICSQTFHPVSYLYTSLFIKMVQFIYELNKIYNLTNKQTTEHSSPNGHGIRYTNRRTREDGYIDSW